MIARDIVVIVCLVLAAVLVVASAVGVLVMPDPCRKLHYVAPVSVAAPVLVTIAIIARMGLSENSGQTLIALVFMIAASPYLSHATLRAIHVRQKAASEERET